MTIQDHQAKLSTVLHILYVSQGDNNDFSRHHARHFADVTFYLHKEDTTSKRGNYHSLFTNENTETQRD